MELIGKQQKKENARYNYSYGINLVCSYTSFALAFYPRGMSGSIIHYPSNYWSDLNSFCCVGHCLDFEARINNLVNF